MRFLNLAKLGSASVKLFSKMGKKQAKNIPTTGGPKPTTGNSKNVKVSGTMLGGPNQKPNARRSITPTETGDLEGEESYSNGLCLQCDLLTHVVEEAVKTFEANPAQNNLHLVMKEIRYMCLEIGQCCGRPDYSDDDDRSTSLSSPRKRIFWKQLQEQMANPVQEQQPTKPTGKPFQPPPRFPVAPSASAPTSDQEPPKEKAEE